MTPSLPEKNTARRLMAVALIVVGAVLILLAPETWPGMVLLVLGVLLELIGMSFSHHRRTHLRNLDDTP
jgi:drug/metabolite transporter (DMT)-like permease